MKKIIITVCFIALSFGYISTSQTDPDAWEVYHNNLQPPKKVMDAINLKAGMIVGEIGAGKGRYAVILAKRVGKKGHVYANDINQEDLDYLKFRCKRDKISNLAIILGKETDPLFPESKLDMVFIVNTYHHISDPVELLRNAKPALKKT
jgi:ubiquinone/menaquinone biosynthesis C-methylase UbiE